MLTLNRTTPTILYNAMSDGPARDVLEREIERVGASASEIEAATAFANHVLFDPRAYDALSPRMRRLVDLVTVAGEDLPAMRSASIAAGSIEALSCERSA